jgi:hypothetical protein
MKKFNLKRLTEVEVKEKYCVEVWNRFPALEDLDTEININSVWQTMRENIKILVEESIGYYELKKQRPWFDGGGSKLLYQRKQAKMKCI